MVTQSQFKDFLSDIEPSSTTKTNASDAHTKLRKYLREHETFEPYHVNTFLSGSYKRDTAIRSQTKEDNIARPDVDIIVVTNHVLSDNPKEVIDLLYNSLKNEYPDIRRQTRSVGIKTDKVDMDVVPIIAPDGMEGTLYIPDREEEKWLVTNPPKHTEWTTEVNKDSGGHFKPLVKLMKWWRRQNPTISKRPKGFVIECIVAECMDREETQYGELFVGTLEQIVEKYAFYVEWSMVPTIEDPGVPGNSVTSGMTFNEFNGFYNKVKAHADLGRKALNEEDEEKSLEQWRKIFGNRFPKSGGKTTNSLLGKALSASALTFPNRPVEPKKPGGYA
ncbi:hypothetical protein ACFO25_16735 [Paenactinomyces guangxiensis]|uniref:Nucleotidyltransferase n=1 Tax=Paenactinomyces guangxiensis TaxID=1490290 RepID=A0A7W1WUN5_9BACL|nr:nucleotidyltransferase [Paenactinomyces guangxiensis]MBA4496303.1 nucleotidyltransferase [Paenactinomyces guangxiensis]MBH8593447.1 hypothetical protein [Paenactinomyces guangxiensis]